MSTDYQIGRAKLAVMEALDDLGATSREDAAPIREVDERVGDLSRYSGRSNFKIIQEMLRDQTIEATFDTPITVWLTPKGLECFRG